MTTCILVVDDSSMARAQVRTMLRREGYDVLEAGDGIEALSQLDEHPDAGLLILDLHMPHMNGMELLESLRARGFQRPVIVLSAEADPEVIRRAKGLGARAWLVKPIRPDALLSTVAKTLASVARD